MARGSTNGLWSAPLARTSVEPTHVRCGFCSCKSYVLDLFRVSSMVHCECQREGCDPLCHIQEALMF